MKKKGTDHDGMMRLFYACPRNTLTEEEGKWLLATARRLALDNDGDALVIVGRLYYEGFLVEQDYTVAREYFKQAASLDNNWAILYCGYCFYYGRNILVDYEAAFRFFSRAAREGEEGYHCALYKLGDMYERGYYVHVDGQKARCLFSQAAAVVPGDSPEFPGIMARLGHCKIYGIGGDKDLLDGVCDLHRAQESAYALLLRGDPYAHLCLSGIKADLDHALTTLDGKVLADCIDFYDNSGRACQ